MNKKVQIIFHILHKLFTGQCVYMCVQQNISYFLYGVENCLQFKESIVSRGRINQEISNFALLRSCKIYDLTPKRMYIRYFKIIDKNKITTQFFKSRVNSIHKNLEHFLMSHYK
jgi:hypothetical protein